MMRCSMSEEHFTFLSDLDVNSSSKKETFL